MTKRLHILWMFLVPGTAPARSETDQTLPPPGADQHPAVSEELFDRCRAGYLADDYAGFIALCTELIGREPESADGFHCAGWREVRAPSLRL